MYKYLKPQYLLCVKTKLNGIIIRLQPSMASMAKATAFNGYKATVFGECLLWVLKTKLQCQNCIIIQSLQ